MIEEFLALGRAVGKGQTLLIQSYIHCPTCVQHPLVSLPSKGDELMLEPDSMPGKEWVT